MSERPAPTLCAPIHRHHSVSRPPSPCALLIPRNPLSPALLIDRPLVSPPPVHLNCDYHLTYVLDVLLRPVIQAAHRRLITARAAAMPFPDLHSLSFPLGPPAFPRLCAHSHPTLSRQVCSPGPPHTLAMAYSRRDPSIRSRNQQQQRHPHSRSASAYAAQ